MVLPQVWISGASSARSLWVVSQQGWCTQTNWQQWLGARCLRAVHTRGQVRECRHHGANHPRPRANGKIQQGKCLYSNKRKETGTFGIEGCSEPLSLFINLVDHSPRPDLIWVIACVDFCRMYVDLGTSIYNLFWATTFVQVAIHRSTILETPKKNS